MPYKLPVRLNAQYARNLLNSVDNFLFDCDGVIWNYPNPIKGSVEFINKLKSLGKKCFFITNNSTKTRDTFINMIKTIGIKDVTEDDIVCTAWVLGGYLKSIGFKDKCYVIASPAVGKELDAVNVRHIGIGPTIVNDPGSFNYLKDLSIDPEVKCVVVGFDHYFSYPKMVLGTTYAVKNPGCLFVATNDDAVFPDPNSKIVVPGTGTFVNAMKTGVGREPIILGKPHKTMWDVLVKTHNLDPKRSCMIGDRLDTDIAFAATCSLGYSLAVLSGVTNEEEIKRFAKYLEDDNNNTESKEAKCVPDFYADCLGEFESYIKDVQN